MMPVDGLPTREELRPDKSSFSDGTFSLAFLAVGITAFVVIRYVIPIIAEHAILSASLAGVISAALILRRIARAR